MVLASLKTLVITGIDAHLVRVEVDLQNGLPGFDIVGLASASIREARERVRSAIKNSGYQFPNRKIIVNLAPADLKKEGSHFDLPIAVGILLASGQIVNRSLEHYYLAGELSLDGTIRKVPGILPMALQPGLTRTINFIVPHDNGNEAALAGTVNIFGVKNLQQICHYLDGYIELAPWPEINFDQALDLHNSPDFSEVRGQEAAKKALQIAAAGMHNVLLIGPPGGGKTMLARRLPGILPPMTREEILETTRIYSVTGLLDPLHPLIGSRPFRSPHKNASAASIIGGGKIPRPGEISLAQNGVLFLDELPEFSRDVLESLRQPLEDKVVTIARSQATYTFPANFSLIASMNPCPCGNFGSDLECRCSPLQIRNYLNRISGPLLDRLDMHVEVSRVNFDELHQPQPQENSGTIRDQVSEAREIQKIRFTDYPIKLNSQMNPAQVKLFCRLDHESEDLLKNVFQRLKLSARAYDRILKVARTIADLDHSNHIKIHHLAESLQYRGLDRKYWEN